MGEAMEVLKDLMAKGGRYVGAEDAGGIVAVEREARDLMRHMVQLWRGQELLGVRTGLAGPGRRARWWQRQPGLEKVVVKGGRGHQPPGCLGQVCGGP